MRMKKQSKKWPSPLQGFAMAQADKSKFERELAWSLRDAARKTGISLMDDNESKDGTQEEMIFAFLQEQSQNDLIARKLLDLTQTKGNPYFSVIIIKILFEIKHDLEGQIKEMAQNKLFPSIQINLSSLPSTERDEIMKILRNKYNV